MQVRDVSENPLARQEASVNKGEDSQLETKILENSIHKICRSDMLPKPLSCCSMVFRPSHGLQWLFTMYGWAHI